MKSAGLALVGSSCSEVETQLKQIQSWGKSYGAGSCSSVTPIEGQSGCSAEITSCVPEHVVRYHGVYGFNDGPNCFNLVLVMSGQRPALVETTSEEMELYKSSPLCRKLQASETPLPGDVGSISDNTGDVHGFIYVSDRLAYTKNGMEVESYPYSLTSLQSVLDKFHVGKKRSEIKGLECFGRPEPQCQERVRNEYYRCKSMEEFLREAPKTKLTQKVLRATELMNELDCRYSQGLFTTPSYVSSLAEQVIGVSHVLKEFVEEEIPAELASAQPSVADRYLLGMLKLRVDKILSSLSLGSFKPYSAKLPKEIKLPEVEAAPRK